MTTVLLVEDDLDIVEMVELFLASEGYQVMHVEDGADVMPAIRRHQPDLVIMDIMLPNISGFECTRSIRQYSNVPVIMLTALVEQTDKLKGLETGADDYMCKPFNAKELLLRAKNILKRTQGQVYYGQWHIDHEKLIATFNDISISFSAVEFNLFSLLFNAPDRVFSREQIIDMAYTDFRDITDRTVDSHIRYLRKKFKDAGIAPSPIESIYGAGYRFHRDPKNQ